MHIRHYPMTTPGANWYLVLTVVVELKTAAGIPHGGSDARVVFVSRKEGDSARVKSTTSSPVVVLIS
jgi:hypothetical protein